MASSTSLLRVALHDLDDGDLVRAYRDRLHGAESALVHRLLPKVRRMLFRVLGPDRDLDDLVQEVFVLFFGSLPTLSRPEALSAFCLGVAVNVARKTLERRRYWRFLPLGRREIERAGANAADAPSAVAFQRLHRVLDTLTAEERLVFVLRHFEEKELAEVAELIGLSLATVKRRLASADGAVRARAKVDPYLSDYVTEEGEGNGGNDGRA